MVADDVGVAGQRVVTDGVEQLTDRGFVRLTEADRLGDRLHELAGPAVCLHFGAAAEFEGRGLVDLLLPGHLRDEDARAGLHGVCELVGHDALDHEVGALQLRGNDVGQVGRVVDLLVSHAVGGVLHRHRATRRLDLVGVDRHARADGRVASLLHGRAEDAHEATHEFVHVVLQLADARVHEVDGADVTAHGNGDVLAVDGVVLHPRARFAVGLGHRYIGRGRVDARHLVVLVLVFRRLPRGLGRVSRGLGGAASEIEERRDQEDRNGDEDEQHEQLALATAGGRAALRLDALLRWRRPLLLPRLVPRGRAATLRRRLLPEPALALWLITPLTHASTVANDVGKPGDFLALGGLGTKVSLMAVKMPLTVSQWDKLAAGTHARA